MKIGFETILWDFNFKNLKKIHKINIKQSYSVLLYSYHTLYKFFVHYSKTNSLKTLLLIS